MNRAEQKEYDRATADLKWWQDQMPEGFTIMGWTYRNTAIVIFPDKQTTLGLDRKIMAFINAVKAEK